MGKHARAVALTHEHDLRLHPVEGMNTLTERFDNITLIPPEYRSVTPPCPRSVKIELTAFCDFKCFFCATGSKLRKTGSIDWELLVRLLEDLRDADLRKDVDGTPCEKCIAYA